MDKFNEEQNGIIGRYYEGKYPVIIKFIKDLPIKDIQKHFPFLTVVSWKYEGSSNNRMPPIEINEKMVSLENALCKTMEKSKLFIHAYSRTGNNLKELIYYSKGIDEFMPLLNKTLENHETYPIDIDFFEDSEWTELKKLLEDFKVK
jgi:hypothetical protein